MLWTMKPTIRNEPSASSPSANEDPIASPSPRLWSPIPIATRVASATPAQRRASRRRLLRAAREPLDDPRQREVADRHAEHDQPGAAGARRERRLELERLRERVEREERQQARRERHEGGQPARVGAAQATEARRARAPPA